MSQARQNSSHFQILWNPIIYRISHNQYRGANTAVRVHTPEAVEAAVVLAFQPWEDRAAATDVHMCATPATGTKAWPTPYDLAFDITVAAPAAGEVVRDLDLLSSLEEGVLGEDLVVAEQLDVLDRGFVGFAPVSLGSQDGIVGGGIEAQMGGVRTGEEDPLGAELTGGKCGRHVASDLRARSEATRHN